MLSGLYADTVVLYREDEERIFVILGGGEDRTTSTASNPGSDSPGMEKSEFSDFKQVVGSVKVYSTILMREGVSNSILVYLSSQMVRVTSPL